MRIILGLIFLVSVVMCAVAGGHIDDPNHDWFEHQRNSAGKSCCEIADGGSLVAVRRKRSLLSGASASPGVDFFFFVAQNCVFISLKPSRV